MKILIFLILSIMLNINCYPNILKSFDFQCVKDINESVLYGRYFYYTENNLYYAKKGTDYIKIKNLSTGKEYSLILPNYIKFNGIYTFCISNDSIFYNDWQQFHCFKIINDTCIYQFSTALFTAYTHMKKINDKIYLFDVAYTSDNIISGHATNVEVINLSKKNQSRTYFPNPSAAGFSFFSPQKVMEIDKDGVYISDFDKYRIMLYDFDSNPIDSIIYKPKEWLETNKEIPKYPNNFFKPTVYIKKIQPFLKKISIIHSIDRIGKNDLLICWSIPKGGDFNNDYRYDIWTKTNGDWFLKESNKKEFTNDKNLIIDNYSISFNNRCRIVGDYLIVIQIGSSVELFKKFSGLNSKDYFKQCEKYFINNNLKTLIGVYKIK